MKGIHIYFSLLLALGNVLLAMKPDDLSKSKVPGPGAFKIVLTPRSPAITPPGTPRATLDPHDTARKKSAPSIPKLNITPPPAAKAGTLSYTQAYTDAQEPKVPQAQVDEEVPVMVETSVVASPEDSAENASERFLNARNIMKRMAILKSLKEQSPHQQELMVGEYYSEALWKAMQFMVQTPDEDWSGVKSAIQKEILKRNRSNIDFVKGLINFYASGKQQGLYIDKKKSKKRHKHQLKLLGKIKARGVTAYGGEQEKKPYFDEWKSARALYVLCTSKHSEISPVVTTWADHLTEYIQETKFYLQVYDALKTDIDLEDYKDLRTGVLQAFRAKLKYDKKQSDRMKNISKVRYSIPLLCMAGVGVLTYFALPFGMDALHLDADVNTEIIASALTSGFLGLVTGGSTWYCCYKHKPAVYSESRLGQDLREKVIQYIGMHQELDIDHICPGGSGDRSRNVVARLPVGFPISYGDDTPPMLFRSTPRLDSDHLQRALSPHLGSSARPRSTPRLEGADTDDNTSSSSDTEGV